MRKYFIDNEEVEEEEFYSSIENDVRYGYEKYYDEMLDECYPEYEIGGCSYCPSDIFKKVDPIAYDCGLDDYIDSMLSDEKYYLERGETRTLNGTEYRIEEEEEDE